ncbi:MAG: CocE/NonD family hydrolase, partial [Thermomicrobiales bacterium]
TEPLAEDMLIIGEPYVVLFATTSAVDTDWTARLCIVDEDDISVNLQEGIVRARFRESLEAPTWVEPGKVYEYRIDLGPVGIRVPAGHRIRLNISSSDFPQWDRNMNTGAPTGTQGLAEAVVATQVILHDADHPSRLMLPVVEAL